jgi:hypothetical protein
MISDVIKYSLSSKGSKDTLSGIASLIGGFMGARLHNSLSQSDLISILRGKQDAPRLVKKLAKMVLTFKDEPVILSELISMSVSFLEKKGFSEDAVLKMVMDYAPILDLQMIHPSREAFTDTLVVLAERIDMSEDEFTHTAGVECPYCEQFFLV